jgi:hypothetical protein
MARGCPKSRSAFRDGQRRRAPAAPSALRTTRAISARVCTRSTPTGLGAASPACRKASRRQSLAPGTEPPKALAGTMPAGHRIRASLQRVLLDRFRLRVEKPQVLYAGVPVTVHARTSVQGTGRGRQDLRDHSRHPLEVVALDHAFLALGLEVVLIWFDSVSVIKCNSHAARALASERFAQIVE